MAGRTDELTHRFGADIADAITAAYEAALLRIESDGSYKKLAVPQRLAMVQALLDEAEAGHVDRDHLREVALIFAPPA